MYQADQILYGTILMGMLGVHRVMIRGYKPVDNDELWQAILKNQKIIFNTAKGLPLIYTVTMRPDGMTRSEMIISRKSKSITRTTVGIAYRKALELGTATGHKLLGVIGASYLYAVPKA